MPMRWICRGVLALGWLSAVQLAGAAELPSQPPPPPPTYIFKDLGTLGGFLSEAQAINQKGQIAGQAYLAGNNTGTAALWNGEQPAVSLGLLPGGSYTQGKAISPAGRVALIGNASGGGTRAAVWWNGALTELPRPQDVNEVQVLGINDSGVAVGHGDYTDYLPHPLVWRDGRVSVLPGIAAGAGHVHGNAYGVNASGDIVGESADGPRVLGQLPTYQATKWVNGVPIDLGRLGGKGSAALAINDAGMIVGRSMTDQSWTVAYDVNHHVEAAVWREGVIQRLDNLGGRYSEATALNNRGQVVGSSNLPDAWGVGPFNRAVIWDGSKVQDLNKLIGEDVRQAGWVLLTATGINDRGWIVGHARNMLNGDRHAFLLKPVSEPPAGCTVGYKVTKAQALSFSVEVTVSNLDPVPRTDWTVSWTYGATPLFYGVKNAKLSVASSRIVKAVPQAGNRTVAAQGSTTFTFSSLKGRALPQPADLVATLGGERCRAFVLP